jgi:hypothetical protein
VRDPVTLIIDPDPGFVCWLGQLLCQAGCQVIPALSGREAVRLVAELNLSIDVAIVDPRLRGVPKAIRTLRDWFPSLKTVAVRTAGEDAIAAIDASATLKRPSSWTRVSRQEWLRSIRRVLKGVLAAA